MASLSGITDQLQRQNQQELASVVRLANEQLTSSGARQGLDEITKIFEMQQGTSLKEFKATKQQISEMQKSLAKLDGVNSAEKRILEQVLKSSQASIGENVTFKKSIGELATNTVEQSIDSIGGTIAGSLSGSPLLAFGASFVGDRFQQFRENKKAAKQAKEERQDRIEQEAELEEREYALLRDQMDNEKVAKLSGKTQSEIDSLTLEQLQQEKDIIISRAKAAKQEAEMQAEERQNIESVQAKFGLDSDDSSSSPSPRGETEIPSSSGGSGSENDLIATNEILERIDSRLHGSPDYLEILNDKIDTLIKDDPTSLDIENERELKRHRKKLEENGRAQIRAVGGAVAAAGAAGNSSMLDNLGNVGEIVAGVSGAAGLLSMFKSKGGLGKALGKMSDMFKGKKGIIAGVTALAVTSAGLFSSLSSKVPTPDGPDGAPVKTQTQIDAEKALKDENIKRAEQDKIEADRKTARNAADRERRARKKAETAAKKQKTFDAETERMTRKGNTSQLDLNAREKISNNLKMDSDLAQKNAKSALATKVSTAKNNFIPKTKPISKAVTPTSVISLASDPRADMKPSGLSAAGSKILKKVPGPNIAANLVGQSSSATKKAILKGTTKIMGTTAAKGVTKVIAKAVPLLGIGAGAAFGLMAYLNGDKVGAALETGGMFLPSLTGTPLDLALVGREVYNATYGDPNSDIMAEKFPHDHDMKNSDSGYGDRMVEIGKVVQDEYDKQVSEYNAWADKHNANQSNWMTAPKISTSDSDATEGKNSMVAEPVEERPTKENGGIAWWQGDISQQRWDKKYADTHNEDGSPKIPEKSESGTEGSITKSISSGNKDVSAISKGVDTGIRIAGSAFMGPDVPLTPMQMGAVDAKVSMGNQISSDIQSAYDLGKISVTSSNTKIDKNLAANETLKTSALDKNAGGNSTNVVASGNKTTTSVTTTNNSVNRLAPPIAIRNPDLTATRARIGLGMGMAF